MGEGGFLRFVGERLRRASVSVSVLRISGVGEAPARVSFFSVRITGERRIGLKVSDEPSVRQLRRKPSFSRPPVWHGEVLGICRGRIRNIRAGAGLWFCDLASVGASRPAISSGNLVRKSAVPFGAHTTRVAKRIASRHYFLLIVGSGTMELARPALTLP